MLLGTYYLPLEQLKDKKGEECIGGHNGKKKRMRRKMSITEQFKQKKKINM